MPNRPPNARSTTYWSSSANVCAARQVVLLREPVRRHQQVVRRIGRRARHLLLLEARRAVPVHLRIGLVLVLVATAAIGEIGLRGRPLRRIGEVRRRAVVAGVAADALVLAAVVERLDRRVAAEAGRRVERRGFRGRRLRACRRRGTLRERGTGREAECRDGQRGNCACNEANERALHRFLPCRTFPAVRSSLATQWSAEEGWRARPLIDVKVGIVRRSRARRGSARVRQIAARQGSVRSMTTARPVAPTLTAGDNPSRSPRLRRGVAGFRDARTDDDRGKFDRAKFGAIAIESSSVNVAGRSLTCLRRIASGIFGPSAARAKMNTVSVGETFAASAGARLTVPATDAPGSAADARRRVRRGLCGARTRGRGGNAVRGAAGALGRESAQFARLGDAARRSTPRSASRAARSPSSSPSRRPPACSPCDRTPPCRRAPAPSSASGRP